MPTPNLYVAASTMVSPRRWFSKQRQSCSGSSVVVPGQPLAVTEHWKSPVPGVYRHVPGSGWYLIQLDSDPAEPKQPDRVLFCAPLDRGILESDYKVRCIKARLPKGCRPALSRPSSPSSKRSSRVSPVTSRNSSAVRESEQPEVSFVRHDDGFTWLNDKDAEGKPTRGPWQRFCFDHKKGEMRVMLKGDDPNWREKASSRRSSKHESDRSRPTSLRSGSTSFASSIRAVAPELDNNLQNPSFLGPRSLHGSAKSSANNSPALSRRGSMKGHTRQSPLSSPGLPQEACP